MARLLGELRRIRLTLSLALLTLVFPVSMYSQSKPADAAPTNATPEASQSAQESRQPQTADPETELSHNASPPDIRQAQIEADTKKLYQLAADLRAEVAKTYKESLSLSVIKKAQEVEKLAKSLKARMGQEAASTKH